MHVKSFVARISSLFAMAFLISYSSDVAAQAEPGTGANFIDIANEWVVRANVEERMSAYDTDLLGDRIDPNTGGITFEHVDVSIPGNFNLPVEIRRKLAQGIIYHGNTKVDFNDWQLAVPKMSELFHETEGPTGGPNGHCTGPWIPPFAEVTPHNLVKYRDYSNGLRLEIPGQGSKSVIRDLDSPSFPASAKMGTVDNWYITCLPSISGTGVEGMTAHAPDGSKYTFDKYVRRKAANANSYEAPVLREYSVWLATKAQDVNGNFVNYNYDSHHRLLSITSSDSRTITLTYTNDLIASVTANGRTWYYTYNTSAPYYGRKLTKVKRPDDQEWEFELGAMTERPSAGADCDSEIQYPPASKSMTVKHPYGMTGTFVIKETRHKKEGSSGLEDSNNFTGRCMEETDRRAGGTPDAQPPFNLDGEYSILSINRPFAEIMSVQSKTLSGPGYPAATWNWTYQGYPGTNVVANQKWTEVVDPVGTKTKWTYHNSANALEGTLLKSETFDGNTVVSQTVATTISEASYGSTYLNRYWASVTPNRQTRSIVTQDGDTYTSNYGYNTNSSASGYSYGNPISTSVNSSFDTTPRVTTQTYEHNLSEWVLGLPRITTLNGTDAKEINYDALGRPISISHYGEQMATLAYHSNPASKGALYQITDANGNSTQLWDWKRGTPQLIKRWLDKSVVGVGIDNRWVDERQDVDDNGWLKRTLNPLSQETKYEYFENGYLKKIDPPKYNDTTFEYDHNPSNSVGLTQTIRKGSATTFISYDGMLRARFTMQSSLPWTSAVTTEYDALGRNTFTTRPTSLFGVETTYDALGRVTKKRDTANGAETKIAYLSYNRTKTTDPEGNYKIQRNYGYGGPGKGEPRYILEYGANSGLLRRTYMYRDIDGRLTRLRQYGSYNGVSRNQSQYFLYNDQKRLCAHYVPEHGETRYSYDALGQVASYGKGHGRTTGNCAPAPTSNLVNLEYDSLGRLLRTDFSDSQTYDMDNYYNDAGQMLRTRRLKLPGEGDVDNELHRAYDEVGNILNETQITDGAPVWFGSQYKYDANGFMRFRQAPSGLATVWKNDGFGHQKDLRQYQANYDNPLDHHQMMAYIDNVTWHPDGSLKSYNAGNGQDFTRGVDTSYRTQSLRSTDGTLKALDLTYQYNLNSQISAIDDYATGSSGTTTHTVSGLQYDGLGQLTQANGWWGNGTFNYDSLGNLLNRQIGTRNIVNQYATRNRLTSSNDSLSTTNGGAGARNNIGYDNRGNMTSLGNLSMIYDLSDQMVGLSGSSTGGEMANGSYRYNSEKKRVAGTVNGRTSYYMYDFAGQLAYSHKEADGEGVTQIRLQNGQSVAKWTGTKLTYLHTDHLGTPIRGTLGNDTDSNGPADGTETFRDFSTPYGLNPTSGWRGDLYAMSGFNPTTGLGSNAGVTGFTGHPKDFETGFTYMQARHYDPVAGRFLSIDPVTFLDTGNPEMFNRYAYVGNNPINFTDPFGLEKRELERVITGSRIPKKITVEAGNLSQREVDKIGNSLPNEVFTQLNGKDLSSYDVPSYTQSSANGGGDKNYKHSGVRDILSIALQIGTGLQPPTKDFPAAAGIVFDPNSRQQAYGQALAGNRVVLSQRALDGGFGQLVATGIHERGHLRAAYTSRTSPGHASIYHHVNSVMGGSGFATGGWYTGCNHSWVGC